MTGESIPFLDDILDGPSQGWWFGHLAALESPHMGTEYPIVRLAEAIHVIVILADSRGTDYVLDPAIGHLLCGFLGLLNGQLDRLDGGICDTWARLMAERIGYCLDHEQMISECGYDCMVGR